MKKINVPIDIVNEMIQHSIQENPNECCGLIKINIEKKQKVYRMTNVDKSPYRYRMDPKELLDTLTEIESDGGRLYAIYHSHTHSEAYPSDTDVRIATWPDGTSVWPDVYYFLVTLQDQNNPYARAYEINDGEISEVEITNN
ncbi:MAG: M67 family metallopeptidase [Dehalococcoidia bacterium]|tara:strand:- start:2776 stop:3201 length:426 start_codon:yes stop_codon:yes gene_type:complete